MKPEIFKAYDIRGIYPTEINAEDTYKIAKAYAFWLQNRPENIGEVLTVALGRDVRLSGPELMTAAEKGLTEMGVNVVNIGQISTDMLYFAVANYGYDGGITISASHNAGEYNGMKLVKAEARPISIDTGIAEIRDLAIADQYDINCATAQTTSRNILEDYVAKMTSFVAKDKVKPLKIVANPNFGASGEAIEKIADFYNLDLIKINFEPDGNFPKGKPDPTQAANRSETEELIKKSDVAFGATWDADADRCFFYDEKGGFILPYYITALMMQYFMKNPGEKILIDPRLRWLVQNTAKALMGEVVVSKSGHSFIKEAMREQNCIFGAEASAHYYFRDLWYTDNGMIPFIIMCEILSNTEKSLSKLIDDAKAGIYALEETNFTVPSVPDTIKKIKESYTGGEEDEIDGFSTEFADWRMNLRGSNTEPVIRLNIEAKSKEVAEAKLAEVGGLINEEAEN